MCAAAPVIGAVVGLLAGAGISKAITPKAPKMPTTDVAPAAPAPNPPTTTVDTVPARNSPEAQTAADKQIQAARADMDQKRKMLSQTQQTTPLGLLTAAPIQKTSLIGTKTLLGG